MSVYTSDDFCLVYPFTSPGVVSFRNLLLQFILDPLIVLCNENFLFRFLIFVLPFCPSFHVLNVTDDVFSEFPGIILTVHPSVFKMCIETNNERRSSSLGSIVL